jgi:hypothetical protein
VGMLHGRQVSAHQADARVGEEVLSELRNAGGEGSLLLTVGLDWETALAAQGERSSERVC